MELVGVYFLSSSFQIDCRMINSIDTIICNCFSHPGEPKYFPSPYGALVPVAEFQNLQLN